MLQNMGKQFLKSNKFSFSSHSNSNPPLRCFLLAEKKKIFFREIFVSKLR